MPANSNNKSSLTGHRKWGLIIVGILAFLLISTTLLYSFWLYPMLKDKVEEALHTQVAKEGTLDYEELDYSLWTNTFWLKSLNFERPGPDSTSTFRGALDKLEVIGINWWQLYFDKSLSVDQIKLDRPRVNMIGQPFAKSDSTQSDSTDFSFAIDEFVLNGGRFTYFEANDTTTSVFYMDSIQLSLTEIIPAADSSQIPFAFDHLEAEVYRLEQLTDNRLYAVKAERIHVQSDQESIRIEGLHYEPQISRRAFAERRIGHIKAQLDIKTQVIHFQEIDLKKLIAQKEIKCHSATVDSLRLIAYRDKSIREIPQLRTLPHQALMRLKWPLRVDTLRIKKGYIEYAELGPKSDEPGVIYFDNLYATAYNLTNEKDKLNAQAPTVDAQARFMGKGLLEVQFQFFPLTPDFQYVYHGHLGEFAIENANEMVDPRLALVLETGMVHSLTFDVRANNQLSEGKMDFHYNNLNAYVHNTETQRKKKFLSFVARVVTHKDNMPSEKNYRQGNIYFEQIPEKPFFHNVWQSVFSGIRSTVFPNLLLKKELDVK